MRREHLLLSGRLWTKSLAFSAANQSHLAEPGHEQRGELKSHESPGHRQTGGRLQR